MVRKRTAEGAEKPLRDSDKLPIKETYLTAGGYRDLEYCFWFDLAIQRRRAN